MLGKQKKVQKFANRLFCYIVELLNFATEIRKPEGNFLVNFGSVRKNV